MSTKKTHQSREVQIYKIVRKIIQTSHVKIWKYTFSLNLKKNLTAITQGLPLCQRFNTIDHFPVPNAHALLSL